MINTVGELIAALQKFPPNSEVRLNLTTPYVWKIEEMGLTDTTVCGTVPMLSPVCDPKDGIPVVVLFGEM